jgi:hypothetical protein
VKGQSGIKMAYKQKMKTFSVTSTGMLYAYDIKAKTKKEAEKKFRDMFKEDLTGEEEIIFDD